FREQVLLLGYGETAVVGKILFSLMTPEGVLPGMHVEAETGALALELAEHRGLRDRRFGMNEERNGQTILGRNLDVAAHRILAGDPVGRSRGGWVTGGRRRLAVHRQDDFDLFHRSPTEEIARPRQVLASSNGLWIKGARLPDARSNMKARRVHSLRL